MRKLLIYITVLLTAATGLRAQGTASKKEYYFGPGLHISLVGKSWMIVALESNSPLTTAQMDCGAVNSCQLLEIINTSKGVDLTVNKKTTMDQILNALIGADGTQISVKVKSKTYKKGKVFTAALGYNAGFDPSSEQERTYISANYPDKLPPEKQVIDSDNDGVPDEEDQCASTSGLTYNHGCPLDFSNFCNELELLISDYYPGQFQDEMDEYEDSNELGIYYGSDAPISVMDENYVIEQKGKDSSFFFHLSYLKSGVTNDDAQLLFNDLKEQLITCSNSWKYPELKTLSIKGVPAMLSLSIKGIDTDNSEYNDRLRIQIFIAEDYSGSDDEHRFSVGLQMGDFDE